MSGQSLSGASDGRRDLESSPMGMEYVVFVDSFRPSVELAGEEGDGSEMWWKAGMTFVATMCLGVFWTEGMLFGIVGRFGLGKLAGSSGRPPAVGEG